MGLKQSMSVYGFFLVSEKTEFVNLEGMQEKIKTEGKGNKLNN